MKYDIYLTGEVGSEDFNPEKVSRILDKKQGEPVFVLVDSLGGYVGTALSIANLFKQHGNVTVYFRGMCASAATIAAMGAHYITADRNALILIHKAHIELFDWSDYNEEDLSARIAELESERRNLVTIDKNVADLYSQRSGKSIEEVLQLMSEERWLTAEDAKSFGLINEIDYSSAAAQVEITSRKAARMGKANIPMPPMAKVRETGFIDRVARRVAEMLAAKAATDTATGDGCGPPEPEPAAVTATGDGCVPPEPETAAVTATEDNCVPPEPQPINSKAVMQQTRQPRGNVFAEARALWERV